ncbi:MAG TPA: FkbM family methyltransferase [Candidatus Sulfotelmatobacter sp.]|nr:FkbM family methyltransferase [Candidatus Sulfotelmatobacter sp.]
MPHRVMVPQSAVDKLLSAAQDLVRGNEDAFTSLVLSHEAALRRISSRGVDVRTVIDVGASDGRWSRRALAFWPDARCHLIEAKEYWRPALAHAASTQPTWSFTIAAAGPTDGTIAFYNNPEDPFSGTAYVDPASGVPMVPQVALDSEIARHRLEPPFLIKLDTHGYEPEILAGARRALDQANLVVVEAYNFQAPGRRFPDLTRSVEDAGFHCIDIGEPLFREKDQAFWQIDLFFVRADRPEAIAQGYR